MMNEQSGGVSRRSILRASLLVGAAAPVGGLLAACSNPGSEGPNEPTPANGTFGAMEDFDIGTTFVATEPVTFGILYREHANLPFDAEWPFLRRLEEEHNVTFDFTNVPWSDFHARKNLLLAAGDAPSLVSSSGVGTVDQFVPAGAVLPISRYVEHMPNFRAKVEEWDLTEDLDRTRLGDGEYYVLPGLLESPKPGYSFAIREDLWRRAGFEDEPTTFEEFREQMTAVKEMFPELDYVFSDRWSSDGPMQATLGASAGSFGTRAGWRYGDGLIWKGDRYDYIGQTAEYRQLLEYYASLVADGLMDPESVTQDNEAAIAKFSSGKSACIGSNEQEILIYRTNLQTAGITDAVLRQIVVPAGPAGNLIDPVSAARFESGWAFSSSAAEDPNFLAMLQFIDWLCYSDEGLELVKWGVEGETFEKAADGTRELLPEIDINGLNPGAPMRLNDDYGYHNGIFMLAHGSTRDLMDSMLRDEIASFRAKMNEKSVMEPGPGYILDELDQEQVSLQQTALQDVVFQATAGFILGQRSFADWAGYVAELESAGMSTYVAKVNDSLR